MYIYTWIVSHLVMCGEKGLQEINYIYHVCWLELYIIFYDIQVFLQATKMHFSEKVEKKVKVKNFFSTITSSRKNTYAR